MLDRIEIRGYKCLKHSAFINLRPLTILTGVNSSGKSSVIQAILMTAQSMQCPLQTNSATLNGPLVQLGTFKEILSTGSDEMVVGFRWKDDAGNAIAKPDEEDPAPPRTDKRYDYMSWYNRYLYRSTGSMSASLESLSLRFSLKASGAQNLELDPLPPTVALSTVDISEILDGKYRSRQSWGARLRTTPNPALKLHTVIDNTYDVGPSEAREACGYEQIHRVHSARRDSGRDRDVVPAAPIADGVLIRRLMPEKLLLLSDENIYLARCFIQDLVSHCAAPQLDPFWQAGPAFAITKGPQRVLENTLRETLTAALRQDSAGESETQSIREFLNATANDRTHSSPLLDNRPLSFYYLELDSCLRKLSPTVLHTIADAVSSTSEEFVDAVQRDDAYIGPRGSHWVRPSHYGSTVMGFIPAYFESRVKYLGPLREAPRPAYEGVAWGDPRDVGTRGERTAAVLVSFGDESVECVQPSGITDANGSNVRGTSLIKATTLWLQFLGVADDVSTDVLVSALGYGLRATAPGETVPRSLSNLGTGVSQVLPVIVMSLLAPRGSLLLFEQPELHLHPRVQARLADFFYSMTLLGKQCIVESHSEYLVDRLRYLCVAECDDRVARNVQLYFTERTVDGTVFKQVEINERGVMADWPAGFFDESRNNSLDILYASLAKREREKKGKK